jgi:hypothetical protein
MTARSLRSAIGLALKARLESITTANGYPAEAKTVWYDKIPMGLELEAHQMPALFLLDEGADIQHVQQQVDIARSFRVQIIAEDTATDEDLEEVVRLVAKAVWANHPTATVDDQYRFHPRVYQVSMASDETDLHMIDANRIATVRMIVHYRTKPYDL